MSVEIVYRIEAMFRLHGSQAYEGLRRESVSALEHALQCALLAQEAHAAPSLIAAALLHDVGHFVASRGVAGHEHVDDLHEVRGAAFLGRHFPPAVLEPVRLHVAAKRYLTAVDPRYQAGLSLASVHSLAQQGGPMNSDEVARFEVLPFSDDAVRLRRWDDLAKTPGRKTPRLDDYLALIKTVIIH